MAWRICIVQTGHALFGFENGVIISNFHHPLIMVDNSDVIDTSKTEDFIKYVQLQRLDRVLVSLFTMYTTLTKFLHKLSRNVQGLHRCWWYKKSFTSLVYNICLEWLCNTFKKSKYLYLNRCVNRFQVMSQYRYKRSGYIC